nr:aspartate/glutamate racemase family protein [Chthonobacter albigriseus]
MLFNPNTTASMTETGLKAALGVAAPDTEVVARTAAMGPVSIEGYYDEAFAVPAVIEAAAAAEAEGFEAFIVACFDDTGVEAARCRVGIPVLGICEAALLMTSPLAKRIAVVTTMARAIVPLTELVHRYGLSGRVTVYAADIPVLALEDPASDASARIEAEIAKALAAGAEAIVLGCAGMADLADRLQQTFGVPVVDGVTAAVTVAEGLGRLRRRTSKRGTYAPAVPKPYIGLLASFAPPG